MLPAPGWKGPHRTYTHTYADAGRPGQASQIPHKPRVNVLSVPEEYLAVSQAAALIGVSVDTLRRWERDGPIKAVRTPTGHRRFKRSDVKALLRD